MKRRFGVIAEDRTDGDVVRTVIRRAVGDQASVKVRAQKGCAKIKAKAARIIADLLKQDEISDVIVVHDLDRDPITNVLNDEQQLRDVLSACCEAQDGVRRLICIPVEELEAWFWSDPTVIKIVGRGKGDAHAEPHRIARPKEALQRLSKGSNAKPRYTTQDNAVLADCTSREFLRHPGLGA